MDVHVCFPSLELVDGRRVDEVDSMRIALRGGDVSSSCRASGEFDNESRVTVRGVGSVREVGSSTIGRASRWSPCIVLEQVREVGHPTSEGVSR